MQLFSLNILVVFIAVLPAYINANGHSLLTDYEKLLNQTTAINNLPTLKRGKRYLDFTKGTRMSWRTTVKNNILKVNTLWGYGFGFRANFPFPDKADRRRPFFKRDVFQSLTDVLDGSGLDGQACILKSFCTAHLDAESEFSSGMLFKLLKYIFTGCVLAVAVVLFISPVNTNTVIRLARASALVTEQALTPSNNTDKEIASISFNGNVLKDNKRTVATAKDTAMNATIVATKSSEPARVLKRGKRYLDFLSTSRIFYRVNGKNNIIARPVIWANGYGFRANFPIESNKKVRPFRRDTYETLGDLMDKSGFDGKACILKVFCAAHMTDNDDVNKGILFKLLKYIFTLNDDDKRHFPYLKHENCQQILHSHCPLSFNNISPFTDDV